MLLHSTKEPQSLNGERSSSYLSLTIPTPPQNCQARAQPTQILSPEEHRYPPPSLWGSQSIRHHRTYRAERRWPRGGRVAAQVSNAEVPWCCVRVLDARDQSGTSFSLGLKLASCQSLDSLSPASGSLFLEQKIDYHFLWHRLPEAFRDTGLISIVSPPT